MKHRAALIIGGGIAGLAAALELAQSKISVTVLEAKNRFGGRIHTIRQNGVPIELGAEFVHGRSEPLLQAIENAGLSTQTVPDTNRTFENGKLQEDSKIWDIISDVLKRVDIFKPDCSIDDFLSEQPLDERTRALVRHFVTGFDAAHTDRISAHACRRAEYSGEQMDLDQQMRVADGYGALVEYFMREIQAQGGRLISGARVKHVRWAQGTVEVLVRRGWNEIFRADAAIITLPVGVLKTGTVKFEPSLPEKFEAANGLEFGNVVKVIFQFKESSWNDFGFIHVPEAPLRTWWSDPRGPVVTGWAGGTHADALLNLSTDQLSATGLEILSKILFNSAPVPDLRQRLAAVHYYNWANDSEIRGAYSYIPVNGLDLPKLLAAPVAGTLFFAGEATVTDAQTGTVFGALKTGQRAARELMMNDR